MASCKLSTLDPGSIEGLESSKRFWGILDQLSENSYCLAADTYIYSTCKQYQNHGLGSNPVKAPALQTMQLHPAKVMLLTTDHLLIPHNCNAVKAMIKL